MTASTNATTITAEPGTPFLEMTRDFDATPAQLFRAATDPELIVQWLGPRNLEMTIQQWDVRPGGGYAYTHARPADGFATTFRGVFHTVRPDEIVIQTFEWEGAPDQVCVETATYTDLGDGRTRLHQRSVFPSVEALEMALQSGMTGGMTESMDRLAELLAR